MCVAIDFLGFRNQKFCSHGAFTLISFARTHTQLFIYVVVYTYIYEHSLLNLLQFARTRTAGRQRQREDDEETLEYNKFLCVTNTLTN